MAINKPGRPPVVRKAGPGRPPGALNKATADIKSLAQQYGPAIIQKLAEFAGVTIDKNGKPIPSTATTQIVQKSAMDTLLDRGFGKATQIIGGDDEGGGIVIKVVKYSQTEE